MTRRFGKKRLDGFCTLGDRRRVGIVWAGNPKFAADRRRSFPLETFLPLTEVAGVRLFSLQVGDRSADLKKYDGQIVDSSPWLSDFTDTAAAVSALDLVVCVDTSVGHLTGALGRPVWILIASDPDWRWRLSREDTDWYPSARLFRQSCRGDWGEVMLRVKDALQELVGGTRPPESGAVRESNNHRPTG